MRGFPPSISSVQMPAPSGGMNTIAPGPQMPQGDCVLLKNMVSGELGLRVRSGWRYHRASISGDFGFDPSQPIRGVYPFHGANKDGSQDRLLTTFETGAAMLRPGGTGGNDVFLFSTVNDDSGRGQFVTISNGSLNFGIYCDDANGYYNYDGGWTSGTNLIVGADATKFVFPCLFKRRLWFVEKDSSKAWYLDVGAYQGTPTAFNFGAQFKNGGSLVGLWNWTYDGGSGPDDRLVAISSNGDVVIYEGTDPDDADKFGIVGVWSVGGVVAGRDIATTIGGDVLIMSKSGLVPLSKLVVGAFDSSQYPSAKIQNMYRRLAKAYGSYRGWSICIDPGDNVLLINIPSNGPDVGGMQLVMSIATGAWSQYVDLPLISMCVWRGELYFGGDLGYTGRMTGYVDRAGSGVTTFPELKINWSLITAFDGLGTAKSKQVQNIRPWVSSDSTSPEIEARALYNFNANEPSGDLIGVGGDESRWDVAQWDSGLWGGDATISSRTWGAEGDGRHVAIAVRGRSGAETVFIGADVDFTVGGEL